MAAYRNPSVRDELFGRTAGQYLAEAAVRPVVTGDYAILVDHPDPDGWGFALLYLNTWGADQLGEVTLTLDLGAESTPRAVSLRVTDADLARWGELKRERAIAIARDAGLRPEDLA